MEMELVYCELEVECIIYYLDEFHTGSIPVEKGTLPSQYRSTNTLRHLDL